MRSNEVEQLVIVNRDDLLEAQRIAADNNVATQIVDVRGIEPISSVSLMILGSATAVATVVQILDRSKGGQVIDLRDGAVKMFYLSKDLVYGLIIVVTADGKVTVEVKEPRGMFGQAVDAIAGVALSLKSAGAAAVGAEVKTVLGDHANVLIDEYPK